MTINERMFSMLEQQGKKAADLCKLLNIGTAQTTAWKTRKTDPPAKYIMQICDFLGTTPEYFLTGECRASEITDNREFEMLRMFRQLPVANQDFIYDSIRAAYDREAAAKTERAKSFG